MGPPIRGVLAAALAEHRERYNAVVAAARRSRADFDPARLEAQLRGPVQAVVEACESAAPGAGSRVLAALFEPVVELVGQRRLGGGSHDALLAALPRMALVVADDPRLVVGSLANALFHLARFGRPVERWLDRVVACSARAPEAAPVLRAGLVAAWAVGMAHYRDSALATAGRLTDQLLGAALGADGSLPATETVGHLQRDRWWRPGRTGATGPAIAFRVGGFRGFGGHFVAPPRLGVRGEHVVVASDGDGWTLHADAFGAVLTRTEPDHWDTPGPVPRPLPPGLRPTAAAFAGDVLAVTVATSYDVLVIDLGK